MSITVSSVSPEQVLWTGGGNKEIGFSRFKLQLSGRWGEISKKKKFYLQVKSYSNTVLKHTINLNINSGEEGGGVNDYEKNFCF